MESERYATSFQAIKDRITESDRRKALASVALENSKFPAMLKAASNAFDGELIEDPERHEDANVPWPNADEDSVTMTMIWSRSYTKDGLLIKALGVEAFSNGTIVIYGGLAGSSVLTQKEWRKLRLREKALGKAMKNPYIIKKEIEWTTT